jgi:hypothetical protein
LLKDEKWRETLLRMPVADYDDVEKRIIEWLIVDRERILCLFIVVLKHFMKTKYF